MPDIFVTLVGQQVAVADSHENAGRQVHEILSNNINQIVTEAAINGESRRSVRVRVCLVTLNQ